MTDQQQRAPTLRTYAAIFAVAALALGAGGYAYYRLEANRLRAEQHDVLAAIGDLKSQQILRWRQERQADATRVASGPYLMQGLAAALLSPGAQDGPAALRERLQRERMGDVYVAVSLLGLDGHIAFTTDDAPRPMGPATERAVEAALASQEAVLSDFFRAPDGRVGIDVAAAMRDAEGRPRAVTVLHSDAAAYLFPLIQSWPTTSRSAETVLVTREGEDVVFLNELRHRPAPALSVRLPITSTDTPVVQAVLGRRGAYEGRDYRGVAVMADLRAIPDSPWFMVAKVDVDEILAEARVRTSLVALLVGSFVLLSGTATAYRYRQRQVGLYRDLYASERQQRAAQDEFRAALGESEERLRLALGAANHGLYDFNVQTGEYVVDAQYARMLGHDPGEFRETYAAWRERLHPDDREEACRVYEDCLAGRREGLDLEFRQRTMDGDWVWIRTRGGAVSRSAEGRPLRLIGTHTNITERRQAEVALRLQSAAVHAAADAIVITDRAGVIDWVNPAFCRLTGYTAEEAIGKNPGELLRSGRHDAAFYRDLWDTILDGRTWRGTLINRRKDGSLYTEAQVVTPIVDGAGAVTHFVAIKQDISDRLALEAQYQQAQKMESVGLLASGIAHDFNNLLTVINGMAEFVLERIAEDDPSHADVREIANAGARAAVLTRQLLAFSRQQILEPRVLDLGALVAGVASLLERLLGEDIELTIVPATDMGRVKADPGQMEQVITNLAVNARDAMPQGGRLTIETRSVEIDADYIHEHGAAAPPGPYVRLSVSDSGTGMDEATRARVFEPFFTTKAAGKGTGLGLSTVYGIVKQSGGFIWIYSEVGWGTTIQIDLPQVAPTAPVDRPGSAVSSSGGTETILLVEDNEGLRKLASRILASAGYTVLEATDGEAGLDVLAHATSPVHLLLTDVVMPGMSGRELAEQLAPVRLGLKVLYMSGYTSDTVVRHGVLDARMPFINKPFTKLGLLGKVREVLDASA